MMAGLTVRNGTWNGSSFMGKCTERILEHDLGPEEPGSTFWTRSGRMCQCFDAS